MCFQATLASCSRNVYSRDSSISSVDVKGLYEGQSEATILVDIYNNLRTTEHCLHGKVAL